MREEVEFRPFPKIARLSREIVITEKIDGTNAQIMITEDGDFYTGSRKRWITPDDDNFGFSKWAYDNREELMNLGPGRHFGEWWGQGIQRKYGLDEKRFSLFNTNRWNKDNVPSCCHVVPELYVGDFETYEIVETMEYLRNYGSQAAPGFMNPEGIIIYHKQGNTLFKKTFEKDSEGKESGE